MNTQQVHRGASTTSNNDMFLLELVSVQAILQLYGNTQFHVLYAAKRLLQKQQNQVRMSTRSTASSESFDAKSLMQEVENVYGSDFFSHSSMRNDLPQQTIGDSNYEHGGAGGAQVLSGDKLGNSRNVSEPEEEAGGVPGTIGNAGLVCCPDKVPQRAPGAGYEQDSLPNLPDTPVLSHISLPSLPKLHPVQNHPPSLQEITWQFPGSVQNPSSPEITAASSAGISASSVGDFLSDKYAASGLAGVSSEASAGTVYRGSVSYQDLQHDGGVHSHHANQLGNITGKHEIRGNTSSKMDHSSQCFTNTAEQKSHVPEETVSAFPATATVDSSKEMSELSNLPDTESYATSLQQEGKTLQQAEARERRRKLKEKIEILRKEQEKLLARKLCRHCKERPVGLTLLPCGHFCLCMDCGAEFERCPICLKTILADVRTFLS